MTHEDQRLIGYLGASQRTQGPRSYYAEFLDELARHNILKDRVLAYWVKDRGMSYDEAAEALVNNRLVEVIIAPSSEAEDAAERAAAAAGGSKPVFGISMSHSGLPRATAIMEFLLFVEVLRQNSAPWPPRIAVIGSLRPPHQKEELEAIGHVAQALDIPPPQSVAINDCDELVGAFRTPPDGTTAIILLVDPLIGSCRHRFPAAAKQSAARGVPVLYGHPDFLRDGGGLVAFGHDARETFKNYARDAVRKLNGNGGAVALPGPQLFIDPKAAPHGFDQLAGPFLGLFPQPAPQ